MDNLNEQKILGQEQDFVIEDVSPQPETETETNEVPQDKESVTDQPVLLEQEVKEQEDLPEKPLENQLNPIDFALEKYDLILEAIKNIDLKFEKKIHEDTHKNELFDKMYNELQGYKTDLYAKILKPFILSTITLIDDTNSFIGKLGENESALAEKYLRTMPEDLIDILESNGVVLYEDDVDKFNPRTQRVVKQVPTDNPDFDNLIVKRVRKGYSWNGVNLKPELVWIYKFKQDSSVKNENQ